MCMCLCMSVYVSVCVIRDCDGARVTLPRAPCRQSSKQEADGRKADLSNLERVAVRPLSLFLSLSSHHPPPSLSPPPLKSLFPHFLSVLLLSPRHAVHLSLTHVFGYCSPNPSVFPSSPPAPYPSPEPPAPKCECTRALQRKNLQLFHGKSTGSFIVYSRKCSLLNRDRCQHWMAGRVEQGVDDARLVQKGRGS